MTEKFYSVILAAISRSGVRMKIISNQESYINFLKKYGSEATLILEVRTLEAWYLERMVKWND
jgi:hypothetical protein